MIKILNKNECRVARVGDIFGKLYYTKTLFGKGFTDITHAIVIDSKVEKPYSIWGNKETTVRANIDLYLADGTVIEIFTDDKAFLKAVDNYTTKKDPRAYYRNQRGVL